MEGRLSKIHKWEDVAREAHYRPAEMSALCYVSSRQLERFFKERFSTTPGRWLRLLQCQLARELLSEGYSTKAIAADLHFASAAHFCREFKKVYGLSPQSMGPMWIREMEMSLLDKDVARGQSKDIERVQAT